VPCDYNALESRLRGEALAENISIPTILKQNDLGRIPRIAHRDRAAGLAHALAGLWWDGKGDWKRAHEAAQQDEGIEGSWVHAYLHRKEGDQGNAAYCHRRAANQFAETLRAEWMKHREDADRIMWRFRKILLNPDSMPLSTWFRMAGFGNSENWFVTECSNVRTRCGARFPHSASRQGCRSKGLRNDLSKLQIAA
jgi:hypothetical protein